jgi:dTMP kinase
VLELNLLAVGGLLPDRTFVLAVDPATAGGRVGAAPDRIERAGADFHARVAAGYERLAALHPDRVVILDGSLPAATIGEQIHDELRRPA